MSSSNIIATLSTGVKEENQYNDDNTRDTLEHMETGVETENSNNDEASTQSTTNATTDNDNDNNEQNKRKQKRMICCLRITIFLLLTGFITFLITDYYTNGYIPDAVLDFLAWLEDNPGKGLFVFIFVFIVGVVLFIPPSIMMLGAGFIFASVFGLGKGLLLASIASFIGAFISSTISFFVARFLLRKLIKKVVKKYKLLRALDAAIKKNGLKICILLRLSPMIPIQAINYTLGASAVSYKEYGLALFAMIPSVILICTLGSSFGSLTEASNSNNKTVTIIVCVLGTIFTITAITLVTYYARKELNNAATIEDNQPITDDNTGNNTADNNHNNNNDNEEIPATLTGPDVVHDLQEVLYEVQGRALTGEVGYDNEQTNLHIH